MSAGRSALIVATDTYEDVKLHRLRTPTTDAEALASVLRDPEIGDFDVTLEINAREHELRRALSAFFADRRSSDLLLVHFGCHGLKDDDGRLYFAASDTDFHHLDATAVPADFVNRRMNETRSKRVVLFLDCCYSGAFASGMTSRAGEQVEIKERFEGSGRVVLTASSAMEYSFEGDHRSGSGGGTSVFTSALVRGLRTGEADHDQDRLISVDELYDYVYDNVREVTPKQTPGKWSFVQGDVYVAKSNYVAPVESLDLPQDLLAMEQSQLASSREALVAELRVLQESRPQYRHAARQALVRLSKDDSRRVSAAALEALGDAETQPEPPRVDPQPSRRKQARRRWRRPEPQARALWARRGLAELIDLLLVLPFVLVPTAVLMAAGVFDDPVIEAGAITVAVALPVLWSLYATTMLWRRGDTFGKRRVGLRVTDPDGRAVGPSRAFAREFLVKWVLFRGIGVLIYLIGFVLDHAWALWSHEQRALHDRVGRTKVIRTGR